MQKIDLAIRGLDRALRVITGNIAGQIASPGDALEESNLSPEERRHSAGLMRVNHVGEVCAQALYEAQGRFARQAQIREQFEAARIDEEQHLGWTSQRLEQLGSHTSVLNPLWYCGAFTLGALAAATGDARSLGFVVETERQVEAHLASHLVALPEKDKKSRAIVDQMRIDEIRHGQSANALGATKIPATLRILMRAAAKIMTTAAYRV